MPRIAHIIAFALVLLLASCDRRTPWHMTDITGVMPQLQFAMTRASDGRPVTADDYLGKIVILYFGYSHCPDICPTTLANLSDALERLGTRAAGVRVLFVTVDPRRDSLSVLRQYVSAFAPQLDGLRGSDNALARLARRYRVIYSVTQASPGRNYEVVHSDSVFFFDRNGHARLVTTDTRNTTAIAEDLERLSGE